MKKWSLFRFAGLVAAITLVVFGGVDNIWRTAKFALRKLLKK